MDGQSCATGALPPKKPCCFATLLKGTLLGGVVAFAYLMMSWMVLPWHMPTLHGFQDEKAVAEVLTTQAPQSGIYVLPFMKDPSQAPAVNKPFAFVSVFTDGVNLSAGMQKQMLQQFGICLLMAAFLTCLLKKQAGGGCCPWMTSLKVGLIAALLGFAPLVVWWHFPLDFVGVGALDTVLTVFVAGAVISCCVLKCDKGAVGAVCAKCGCTVCKCSSTGGGCCPGQKKEGAAKEGKGCH